MRTVSVPVPRFVAIPAGPFLMGSDPGVDVEASPTEGPLRQVSLDAFEILERVVWRDWWFAFVEESRCSWAGRDELLAVAHSPGAPAGFVSWFDAVAFVDWLNAKADGFAYALPTEAQWERACRGTRGRIWPWDVDELPEVDDFTDLRAFGIEAAPERLRRGGACLDMFMSATEWTADNLREFGEADDHPAFRVIKGGACYSGDWPRCVWRGANRPTFRHADLGFRVVRTPLQRMLAGQRSEK